MGDEPGIDGEVEVVRPSAQVLSALFVRVEAKASEVLGGGVSVAPCGRGLEDVVVVGSASSFAPPAGVAFVAFPLSPADVAPLEGEGAVVGMDGGDEQDETVARPARPRRQNGSSMSGTVTACVAM